MTLDELLEAAHRQARGVLLNKADEQLLPTWLLVTETGEKMVIATPWNGPYEKDLALALMRRAMTEKGVVAYSFLSEGWAVTRPPGAKLVDVQPSEQADRREVVTALACDRMTTKCRAWTIRRDRRGRVVALIEEDRGEPHPGQTFGRFDGLLARPH